MRWQEGHLTLHDPSSSVLGEPGSILLWLCFERLPSPPSPSWGLRGGWRPRDKVLLHGPFCHGLRFFLFLLSWSFYSKQDSTSGPSFIVALVVLSFSSSSHVSFWLLGLFSFVFLHCANSVLVVLRVMIALVLLCDGRVYQAYASYFCQRCVHCSLIVLLPCFVFVLLVCSCSLSLSLCLRSSFFCQCLLGCFLLTIVWWLWRPQSVLAILKTIKAKQQNKKIDPKRLVQDELLGHKTMTRTDKHWGLKILAQHCTTAFSVIDLKTSFLK